MGHGTLIRGLGGLSHAEHGPVTEICHVPSASAAVRGLNLVRRRARRGARRHRWATRACRKSRARDGQARFQTKAIGGRHAVTDVRRARRPADQEVVAHGARAHGARGCGAYIYIY